MVKGFNHGEQKKFGQKHNITGEVGNIVLMETNLNGAVGDYTQQLMGNMAGSDWQQSGILVMWNKRSWKGEKVEYGNQSITCKLLQLIKNYLVSHTSLCSL